MEHPSNMSYSMVQQAVNACKKMGNDTASETKGAVPPDSFVAPKHNLIYCPIPKVGTTFTKRIFQLGLSERVFTRFIHYITIISRNELQYFLNSSSLFTFVREPYGRLLSAYLDKSYTPDSLYWHEKSKNIIQEIRQNPSPTSLQCGHDVTFSEFIKYILRKFQKNETINEHYAPMCQMCDPCRYKFDFIGRLETFKEDMEYLLDHWRTRFGDINVSYDDFEKKRIYRLATHYVRIAYGTKDVICYPFYKTLLRTWRVMQIRGFISKDIDVPVTRQQAETITAKEYLTVLLETFKKSVNRISVKLQRKASMLQAYASISRHDMEQLRNYVHNDCTYFGYNETPQELFARPMTTTPGDGFDYYDQVDS